MKKAFRTWLDGEAAGRDPAASLEAIERRAARPRRGWLLLAPALAAALLLVAAWPRDAVFQLYVAVAAQPTQALELEMHSKRSLLTALLPHLGATLAALAIGTAHAEPAPAAHPGTEGFPTRRITLEVRAAAADDVFKLLGQFSGTRVVAAPCVAQKKLDLRMRNVPAKLVLDAVGAQLGLAYTFDGHTLTVACR